MKLRFKALLVLVLLAHLFSTNLAWACYYPSITDIEWRCSSTGQIQHLFSQHGNVEPADLEALQTQLNQISAQCGVEEQVTTKQLQPVLTQWSSLGYSNLIFEPYTENREWELQLKEQLLHRCLYESGRRVGGWLAISTMHRDFKYDYCQNDITNFCYFTTVKLVPFIGYLVTNPRPAVVPYLTLFIFFTGLALAFFYKLLTRDLINIGYLGNFFLAILLIVFLIPIWPTAGQLIGWVLSCYFLVYGWHTIQIVLKRLAKKNEPTSPPQ